VYINNNKEYTSCHVSPKPSPSPPPLPKPKSRDVKKYLPIIGASAGILILTIVSIVIFLVRRKST
jgi:hypothetical protein